MKGAYTVIELLVVVGIIVVLAALLFPVLGGAKKEANKSVCASNMHQIYLAAKLYQEDHGEYPRSNTAPEFKPYYKTVLMCPASKHMNQPNMRAVDYMLLGKAVPQDQAAVDACREIRGQSLPLVIDLNHIEFLIKPTDKSSKYLLVREDGSFDSVLAASISYGPHVCEHPSPPFWYNF